MGSPTRRTHSSQVVRVAALHVRVLLQQHVLQFGTKAQVADAACGEVATTALAGAGDQLVRGHGEILRLLACRLGALLLDPLAADAAELRCNDAGNRQRALFLFRHLRKESENME